MPFPTIFLSIKIKPGCALKGACILERGLKSWASLAKRHVRPVHPLHLLITLSVERSSKREKDKNLHLEKSQEKLGEGRGVGRRGYEREQ